MSWILILNLSLLFISSLKSAETVAKELVFDNRVYEENIKGVQIYSAQGYPEDVVQPAVISIAQAIPIVLEFDDLYEDVEDYRAKIMHCNGDWTHSQFLDLEILDEYNEFRITDYELSFNTRTEYVHYRFRIPRVKISGNYLLVVFRGTDETDLILSRRFMIFEPRVEIKAKITVTPSQGTFQNQQIDFRINHGGLYISNPMDEIQVVIRQNQRWDNAITNLKPSFIRTGQSVLDYEYYNFENNFKAFNEFRFFDLRILNATGQNVGKIDLGSNYARAFLLKDKTRGPLAYSQYTDINGQYVVNNLEVGGGAGATEAEYVDVFFFLEYDRKIDGEIYLFGALTDWRLEPEFALQYDEVSGGYAIDLILKQAWYNYMYLVKDERLTPHYLEGSHSDTENLYEILVYHRTPMSRGDKLVGYVNLVHNRRR